MSDDFYIAELEESAERAAICEFDGGHSWDEACLIANWCTDRRYGKIPKGALPYQHTMGERASELVAMLEASVALTS